MPDPTPSPTLSDSMRTGLRSGAFLGLAIGFFHAAFGSASSAGVALGAGILLLLLSEADKFEVLKGFGFEAKMHRLTTTMAEAQRITENLRALALSTARIIIALVSSEESYGEICSRRTAWGMIEGARESLVNLEIDQAQIDEVLNPYYRLVERHLIHSGARSVENMLGVINLTYPGVPDVSATISQSRVFYTGWNPEECRRVGRDVAALKDKFPDGNQLDPQEFFDIADDLEHWQSRRRLRRPDAYFDGV